ncbi:hypothetical protein Tco_0892582 [Tanacetum coccineum]|uniref:Synaptobrevin, longin-like domain protein n=1 Tax=Tanacetum coccineum TaxID=301880 RepID=A0ABQ5C6C3_9ASTR
MVAFLKKPEGSEGFHQIVDFLNSTHIKYALTENPTIYVSLIHQFWQTASASTSENGEMEITATIDGRVKTVTEASIRRHLKLEDSDGISTLPNTEIFEQLALMGYVSNSDRLTFQKGHFSPQWRFLIHTILHCLSAKKTAWDQFSSNIATAIICLATNRTFNFSKLIFDGMLKNLDNQSKFLMYPRFIQIFLNKHKRQLLPHKRTYIAPTLTQKLFGNMRRISKGYNRVDIPLFPTMLVQGLIFQGEGSTVPVESHHTPTSAPSTSQPPTSPPSMQTTHVAEEAATMPHDSPLLRVHSLGSDEGNMTLHELTILCTILCKKVESLGSDLKQTKLTYGATYTKLIMKVKKLENRIKSSKSRRRVRLIVSKDDDDLEDPSKQGRKIAQLDKDEGITQFIAPEEVCTAKPDISTANVSVSTAGANVSTASPEVKTAAKSLVYIRRSAAKRKDKGKAIMKEAKPIQKKTKLQLEQERLGYEEALRLQEQLDEEERQRIGRVHEEANTFNAEEWDNIQAQIEADEELAQKLQAEERGKFSKVEKARLLVEMINERKRLSAQERAEQRRNKPMTQAQQRTYMCNYIKHMDQRAFGPMVWRFYPHRQGLMFESCLGR